MAKRNINLIQLGVLELESREVPTILGTPQVVNGVVSVQCSTAPTTVLVTQSAGGVQIEDVIVDKTWSFAPGTVKRVDVHGGGGDDSFTSRGSAGVGVRMYAGSGDTTMYGGQGRTIMVGGSGDDHLYGRSGDDYIDGGAGDDFIHVARGKNVLIGNDGNDTIIGGTGTDAITGGNGNNTIVAISSITSKIDPGPGANVLWLAKNGTTSNKIIGPNSTDIMHEVASFANGASLILNGGPIAEPTTLNGESYESFSDHPLFSSAGPTIDDIVQSVDATGNPVLDDSWLLAALGSIVNANPALITQNMVDFGDGTYGVALGSFFFRVDNQLPVTNTGQLTPAYAGLGDENSIWVPILEKAFADYQGGSNNYAALNGTGGASPAGLPTDVFNAFGFTGTSFSLSQFVNTTQLGTIIKSALSSGLPAVIGVTALPAMNPPPLIAGQDYSLLSYNTDALGDVTTVVLRNPMGIDGGGSTDSDPNDGLLTININDLLATTGTIQFGGT